MNSMEIMNFLETYQMRVAVINKHGGKIGKDEGITRKEFEDKGMK